MDWFLEFNQNYWNFVQPFRVELFAVWFTLYASIIVYTVVQMIRELRRDLDLDPSLFVDL